MKDIEQKLIYVGYSSTGHAALKLGYLHYCKKGFVEFREMVVSPYPVDTSIAIRRYIDQGLMIRVKRATYVFTRIGARIAKQLPHFQRFQDDYLRRPVDMRRDRSSGKRNFPRYIFKFRLQSGEMLGESLIERRMATDVQSLIF